MLYAGSPASAEALIEFCENAQYFFVYESEQEFAFPFQAFVHAFSIRSMPGGGEMLLRNGVVLEKSVQPLSEETLAVYYAQAVIEDDSQRQNIARVVNDRKKEARLVGML